MDKTELRQRIMDILDRYDNITYNASAKCFDVNGDISITDEFIANNMLIMKFGKVTGDFEVGVENNIVLKNLYNSPRIVLGSFIVGSNVASLEKGTQNVKEWYKIVDNPHLKNLIGAPKKCNTFIVNMCYLKTLIGAPEYVKYNFYLQDVDVKDLTGGPKFVGGEYGLNDMKYLVSLEGMPEVLPGSLKIKYCRRLDTLAGISKKIGKSLTILNVGNIYTLKDFPKVRKVVLDGSLKLMINRKKDPFDINSFGELTQDKISRR